MSEFWSEELDAILTAVGPQHPVVRKQIEAALSKVRERGRDEVNKKWEEALQHISRPSFLARYEGKERKGISEAAEHLRAIRTEAKQ